MFIELVTNNVKYNLMFPEDKRVLFLTGDSSTGKTALLSIKESIEKQSQSSLNSKFITDGLSYIRSDKTLVTPDSKYLEYEIIHNNTEEYLFILDEDNIPFRTRKLKSLIEPSNANFILITRDFLIKDFNRDVSAVYVLEKVNEVIIAKEYFADSDLTPTPRLFLV